MRRSLLVEDDPHRDATGRADWRALVIGVGSALFVHAATLARAFASHATRPVPRETFPHAVAPRGCNASEGATPAAPSLPRRSDYSGSTPICFMSVSESKYWRLDLILFPSNV